MIRVPSGLERAIEAALAENLFAIVMEREADVRKAVELLLAGDIGRATMYALDSLQDSRPLHLIKERGIVGVASGLVRCDHRYRKLIDTLLGRTVVVENIELAQRVVRRGLAGAVATMDGVLVRPVGSVTGRFDADNRGVVRARARAEDLPKNSRGSHPQLEAKDAALAPPSPHSAPPSGAPRNSPHPSKSSARSAATSTPSWRQRSRSSRHSARACRTPPPASASGTSAFSTLSQQRERRRGAARSEDDRSARPPRAKEQEERARSRRWTPSARPWRARSPEQAADVAELDGALPHRAPGDRGRAHGARAARAADRRKREQQRIKTHEESQSIAGRLATTERELTTKYAEVDGLPRELEPAREELAQFESRERAMSAQLAESNEKLRSAERALVDAENDVRIAPRRTRDAARRTSRPRVPRDGQRRGRARARAGAARSIEPEYETADVVRVERHGDLPPWLRTDDDGDRDLPPVRGGSPINATEVRDRIADLRASDPLARPHQRRSRERVRRQPRALRLPLAASSQTSPRPRRSSTTRSPSWKAEIRERFRTTFKTVNREFERYFSAFFRGGTARLELGETDEYGLPGVEIFAQPPGKKLGSLALLSGGERSLTAVALLFALLQANPSPICVLDEVDAALDEANVGRFVEELRALSERTQFIIITHNRRTIETADTIYGVIDGRRQRLPRPLPKTRRRPHRRDVAMDSLSPHG